MRRESCATWTFILLILTLVLAGAAGAAEMRPSVSPSLVSWEAASGFQLTLTVSGPGGLYHRAVFAPGDAPQFGFSDSADLGDGVYTWELIASPAKPAKRGVEPSALSAAKGFVSSGSFSVAGGAFVDPTLTEAGAEKDVFHNDDVIVTGSLCVGFDCVNGENFGFDTERLKENNLRIHFDDTSSSGSFPNNDWRIRINDSSNGGAEYFAIEDSSASTTPFRIQAGAGNNALWVDSAGDVGLGTSNPVVELHISDGDTPTLRLEQNGSSGFTPQTWDIAGNEANFFVRDVTGGSDLVLKIKPGAPTSSIFVAANGNIGTGGEENPDGRLHIRGNSTSTTEPTITLESTDGAATTWEIRNTPSNGRLTFSDDTTGTRVPFKFAPGADNNLLRIGFLDASTVDINGNLTLTGTCSGCDAVFGPDFELESIDEHAASMWENSYLPAVGPTAEGPTAINVFEKTTGILQELEKAHIYIEQLHRSIRELEGRLEALETTEE